MITAIIIDDDVRCRNAIKDLVVSSAIKVEVIGEAGNADVGRKLINEHHPDLVFLDVEMPGKSGFDMLDEVKEIDFDIIFTTGYDKYAIQAIRCSALDFLPKPVIEKEFEAALKRFETKKVSTQVLHQVEVLLQNYGHTTDAPKRIAVPTMEGLEFIATDQIIRLEAERSYTSIILKSGLKLLVSRPLKEMEVLLKGTNFFRTHYSHLININYLRKYRKADALVVMDDGSEIPLSRHRKDEFLDALKKQ